ncbi:MAG: nuclear transport factor 2 family protein [Pseudomonadota bacterium]
MSHIDARSLKRIDPDPMTDFVEKMEAAVGQGNWTEAATYFTPDVLYRVGCREPFSGVAGIREYMEWQNTLVRWDGHNLRSKFARGEVAFFEVDSLFTRHRDGAKLVVPCTDIYTFEGGRIADWRVYADTSAFSL